MLLNYPPSENPILLELKEAKALSAEKLCFLYFLVSFGPATVNEIIEEIGAENGHLTASKLRAFNKLTKPLKNINLVEVVSSKKIIGKRKPEEIIQFTNRLPQKSIKVPTKAMNLAEGSFTCALLAVEFYNKPFVEFRTETYLTLMCVAWTKILQALILKKDGEIYYERDKNKKIIRIEGIKKTWALERCVDHCLTDGPLKENLNFLIQIRNRFVHSASKSDFILDAMVFGECQAMLFNFEHLLKKEFPSISVNGKQLDLALQFSQRITSEQWASMKNKLNPELKDIKTFIDKFRSSLNSETFNSPQFTHRIVLVPVVSNSGRGTDFALEFIKEPVDIESLRSELPKITVLEKEKIVNVANVSAMLPGEVVDRVSKLIPNFTMYYHTHLSFLLGVRPIDKSKPYKTNNRYCIYDKPVKKYLFTNEWVDLLIKAFQLGILKIEEDLKNKIRNKSKIDLVDIEKKIQSS